MSQTGSMQQVTFIQSIRQVILWELRRVTSVKCTTMKTGCMCMLCHRGVWIPITDVSSLLLDIPAGAWKYTAQKIWFGRSWGQKTPVFLSWSFLTNTQNLHMTPFLDCVLIQSKDFYKNAVGFSIFPTHSFSFSCIGYRT